ncbi:MAG: sodium:solute symporter [candidate division KSB1 bacterium]|nr:sodium:solute symporter [candidate division KSB1 bacterium]
MEPTGWVSVLPPVVAIALAIWSRQVFISLFMGIWLGWTILSAWNPVAGLVQALEGCVRVFQDPGNAKVILFSAMVGALITFTQYSGGMDGFVNWVSRRGLVNSRRSAGLLAWVLGVVVFVESSICVLISGTVCRPLFDRLRVSREKLAYICDSTSAPKCIMIPLNAWGAFVIGLLTEQRVEDPVRWLVSSMPLNFYAILALLLVLLVVLLGRDIGPMRAAERRVREEGKVLRDGAEPLVSADVTAVSAKPGVPARAVNAILPIGVMVAMMPLGLLITGQGNLMRGSGSTAVFWAVIAAVGVAAVAYRVQGIMTVREITDQFMKGVGGLVPLALLMVFAFAIGAVCRELGTGPFVANIARVWVAPGVVPALLFLAACVVAFSTGTSFGTFAIMIPIAVPMVGPMGLHPGLVLSAVLGGGVFGDHCSPISDTTIISSMAAATDHIDHVNTQLPYALVAAGLATVLYLIVGFATSG